MFKKITNELIKELNIETSQINNDKLLEYYLLDVLMVQESNQNELIQQIVLVHAKEKDYFKIVKYFTNTGLDCYESFVNIDKKEDDRILNKYRDFQMWYLNNKLEKKLKTKSIKTTKTKI